MATSPIYSWPEPDNTDLVKNGALAIRTLGNAIDTTMATMTPKSIVDAKGDLIAASANDTPARLAVGNNGETLVADSSATTGLRWAATPSASNPVLNSAFQVWQRGTSIAGTSTIPYTADRWQLGRAGSVTGSTVSRQATGDTTNLPNIQYCARVQRDSGNTSTAVIFFMQSFETLNAIPYAGKTIALSFYARAGANFSAASSLLGARIDTGTGTDQNVFTGYTGSATPINTPVTLTTTWQRFTVTGTIASTATEFGLLFNYSPTGTAGANDHFEITGVQIDVGSVALPFRTYAATIQQELAACQRYFQKSYEQATAPGASTAMNSIVILQQSAVAYGAYAAAVKLPVTMRTSPTYTVYSPINGTTSVIADAAANTNMAAGSGTVGTNSSDSSLVIRNITTTPATITPNFGGFSFQYTASAEL